MSTPPRNIVKTIAFPPHPDPLFSFQTRGCTGVGLPNTRSSPSTLSSSPPQSLISSGGIVTCVSDISDALRTSCSQESSSSYGER
eukprot:760543-Hanusia_phi.AAC.2